MPLRLKTIVIRSDRPISRRERVGPSIAGNLETVIPVGAPPMGSLTDSTGDLLNFQDMNISIEDPTLEETQAMDRDEQVFATIPSMPIMMIEPQSLANEIDVEPAASNWGIEAISATNISATGEGVTVAILDTGIDCTHPAFAGVNLVKKNYTTEADDDIHGHGTHCAGTVFGRDVDGRRIGVAPGVTKALIGKVLGAGGNSTDVIYRAMQWAMSEGAHVISMSLGMDFPGYQRELTDQHGLVPEHATSIALAGYRANIRLFDAISRMVTVSDGIVGGTIVVAAAGNESNRPNYAITVSPPAAAEHFLSVGALQQNSDPTTRYSVARFSNEGPRISAPGVDIVSAKIGGGLKSLNGTSMAAPHVAGAAALWSQHFVSQGTFRAVETMQQISNSATALPHLASRDVGLGIVQAPQ